MAYGNGRFWANRTERVLEFLDELETDDGSIQASEGYDNLDED